MLKKNNSQLISTETQKSKIQAAYSELQAPETVIFFFSKLSNWLRYIISKIKQQTNAITAIVNKPIIAIKLNSQFGNMEKYGACH